jgi:hypothetical protein
MTSLIKQLMRASDAFGTARGISRARVSTLLFNSGHKLDAIHAGRDVTTGTYERAIAWLSKNWPDDSPWPKGVHRPGASDE